MDNGEGMMEEVKKSNRQQITDNGQQKKCFGIFSVVSGQWSVVPRVLRFTLHASLVTMFLSLSGCETIPIIGRSQLSLIPASQLVVMGNDSFSKLISFAPTL